MGFFQDPLGWGRDRVNESFAQTQKNRERLFGANNTYKAGSAEELASSVKGQADSLLFTPNANNIDPNAANIQGYDNWRGQLANGATASANRQGPANVTGATINQNPQDQFRQAQTGLVGQLQAQANGTGPSLAQGQLQQATDRNISQAMALGASQHGMGGGGALRGIQQQQAGYAQQAASDSALLRMQEQMQAQNQLGQVLSGARGQDIGLATDQAGFNQQANLANQSAQLAQGGLNDKQVQFYVSQGMSLDQAQQQARMEMEKLRSQQHLGLENLRMMGVAARNGLAKDVFSSGAQAFTAGVK